MLNTQYCSPLPFKHMQSMGWTIITAFKEIDHWSVIEQRSRINLGISKTNHTITEDGGAENQLTDYYTLLPPLQGKLRLREQHLLAVVQVSNLLYNYLGY